MKKGIYTTKLVKVKGKSEDIQYLCKYFCSENKTNYYKAEYITTYVE